MNYKNISVVKADGTKERFDIDKIHRILEWATDDIKNVSVSELEMQLHLNIVDGMTTDTIHNALIDAADSLITKDNTDYSLVANRLLNFRLRKLSYGGSNPPSLKEHIRKMVNEGWYHEDIWKRYTEEELEFLESKINHNRDFDVLPFSGTKAMMAKYLFQNRHTNTFFETPQFRYMITAMDIFNYRYWGKERLEKVADAYEEYSLQRLNLPSPLLVNGGSDTRQYASCVLMQVDDTTDSIIASNAVLSEYVTLSAGIGLEVRYRAKNSPVKGGKILHDGNIPFLKIHEAVVKGFKQANRGGSATVYSPFWHKDVIEYIHLNARGGTEDTRIYKLDYGLTMSDLVWKRYHNNEDLSLFCPNETNLFEYWGKVDENGVHLFDAEYERLEADPSISRTTINAREFLNLYGANVIKTGRNYPMGIDNANRQSSFKDSITQSNLCTEITLPTKAMQSVDDPEAEIATCILGAINMVNTSKKQLEKSCRIMVETLDALIDHQIYPNGASERFTKLRRAIGIGVTGLADYLAWNKVQLWEQEECLPLVEEYINEMAIHTTQASIDLAKRFGACEKVDRTYYADGIVPIDRRNKHVDELIPHNEDERWGPIREQLKEYGIRNSTLFTQMPCESSSDVQGVSNGIEMMKSLIINKKDRKGFRKTIAKYIKTRSKNYTFTWSPEYNNEDFIKMCAVIQKYFDQGMSVNTYVDTSRYVDGIPKVEDKLRDMAVAQYYGLKTLYYTITKDGAKEYSHKDFWDTTNDGEAETGVSCAGDSCTI